MMKEKIQQLIDKAKSLFKKRPRIVFGIVIVLALSLPFVVNQVLKQQDLRQHASTAPPITIYFGATETTVKVGEYKCIGVIMDTKTNDIGALHFKLNYPGDLIGKYPTSSVSYNFTTVKEVNTYGLYEISIVNPSVNQVTNARADVMKFCFTPLKVGVAKITMSDIQATATKYAEYVPIENSDNIIANITIVDTLTNTSPTPVCTMDTNKPLECSCTQDSQCSSQKCAPISGYPDRSICVPYLTVTPAVSASPPPLTVAPSVWPNPTGDSPTTVPTVTPAPTLTLAPTTTPVPGETNIRLGIILPGIGNGSANLGLNPNPIHPQRVTSVQILDINNSLVKQVSGPMTYNSSSGKYLGVFALGKDFTTGSYNIKIKLDNTLAKIIPVIFQITKGQDANTTVNFSVLTPGDLNGDNTLGIIDWTLMIACIKNETACTEQVRGLADLNDNGTIDELDVQLLQRGFAIRNGD